MKFQIENRVVYVYIWICAFFSDLMLWPLWALTYYAVHSVESFQQDQLKMLLDTLAAIWACNSYDIFCVLSMLQVPYNANQLVMLILCIKLYTRHWHWCCQLHYEHCIKYVLMIFRVTHFTSADNSSLFFVWFLYVKDVNI